MKEENIPLALLIAKRSGFANPVKTSTSRLAREAGISQQTVSRKLRELESDGLIERKPSTSGIEVKFTVKGRFELEALYLELEGIFSKKSGFSLPGKVMDGLGEGAYYTSLSGYKKQFDALFGEEIFPGTLNLEVEPTQRNMFTSINPLKLEGFKTAERTFGGIDGYRCKINGKIDALAIIPHRTNHPANILEIVSPTHLRKKLSLKNGSQVEVSRQ